MARNWSDERGKWKTLTQVAEEARAHACERCDVWRVSSFQAALAKLADAQKISCNCERNCGWNFCGSPVLPPTLADEAPPEWEDGEVREELLIDLQRRRRSDDEEPGFG
jgi:hypothetical protein